MKSIRKILVPFDFSDESDQALRMAFSLSQECEAILAVLHVIEPSSDDNLSKLIAYPEDPAFRLKQKIEEEIRELLPEDPSHKKYYEILIRKGSTPIEILMTAEKEKAGLIVMSPQGHLNHPSILLGNIAAKMMRRSHLPVFFHRDTDNWIPRRILVPIDFSNHCRQALDWGGRWAKELEAELYLLHVADLHSLYTHHVLAIGTDRSSLDKALRQQVQDQLTQWAQSLPVRSKQEVRIGDPSLEIQEVIRNYSIDLVIVTTHVSSESEPMVIGNVAEKIIRYSPCSVMVIRPPEFAQPTSKFLEPEEIRKGA